MLMQLKQKEIEWDYNLIAEKKSRVYGYMENSRMISDRIFFDRIIFYVAYR